MRPVALAKRCYTMCMRKPRPAAMAVLAAALCIPACQAYVQQRQAQQQAERQAAIRMDHGAILIYTGDIDRAYDKLGDLSYTEPLTGESIGSHHINEKLREMAIARWGKSVDAIIHVSTKVGGTSTTTISVTGEAVEMKGNCDGCRHTMQLPPPPT